MVQDLLTRQIVHFAHQYGKDAEGNIVLSQESLVEIANKVAEVVHKSIERPVVTTTINDVHALASRAGFKLEQTKHSGVPITQIKAPGSGLILDQEIGRLVDFTTQLVLERITASTAVREV